MVYDFLNKGKKELPEFPLIHKVRISKSISSQLLIGKPKIAMGSSSRIRGLEKNGRNSYARQINPR